MNRVGIGGLALIAIGLCALYGVVPAQLPALISSAPTTVTIASPKIQQLVTNAIAQTKITHSYDPAYVKLAYPGGDVPLSTGVCTDVVIRAFRAANIDLQQQVHQDMQRNFAVYPRNWGAKLPDANIDHRRVPNLMTWLQRQGRAVPITNNGRDYQPGDIVTWGFSDGQQHIGIVSNIRVSPDRLAIVHNVGTGTKVDDVLFQWQQIGHYRYF